MAGKLRLALLALDAGTRDAFGNPIPSGRAFDVGPHEYTPLP